MNKTFSIICVALAACTGRFPEFEPGTKPDPKRSAQASMQWGWNGKEAYTSWVKDNDNNLNFQYLTGPRVTLFQGMFNMTPKTGAPIPRTTKIEPGNYRLVRISECFGPGCKYIDGNIARFTIADAQNISFPSVAVLGFDKQSKKVTVKLEADASGKYEFGKDVEIK
ncbi:MAG: hypothetical protein LBT92_01245 [Rickettsiales bacterium]|jgi:hypothetical protein|nr:hypothetical protein [Rickettsiales bacterium]